MAIFQVAERFERRLVQWPYPLPIIHWPQMQGGQFATCNFVTCHLLRPNKACKYLRQTIFDPKVTCHLFGPNKALVHRCLLGILPIGP